MPRKNAIIQCIRPLGLVSCLILAAGLLGAPGALQAGKEKRSKNRVGEDRLRGKILKIAKKYIGVPYRFGGASPSGFDCSGYAMYVYGRAGVSLPHGAGAQYKKLRPVKKPRPGDLVFYKTYLPTISHVGIYVGNGRFLHSPRSGRTVSYANMKIRYWRTRYAGAATAIRSEPAKKKKQKKKTGQGKYDPALLHLELIIAIYEKDLGKIRRYLNLGANPNAPYRGWSPLMLAVDLKSASAVRLLIGGGARVNFVGPGGWTALALAEHHRLGRVKKILRRAGAVGFRFLRGSKRRRPNIRRELF